MQVTTSLKAKLNKSDVQINKRKKNKATNELLKSVNKKSSCSKLT